MQNVIEQPVAVVLEPVQTAIPNAELNQTPTTATSAWAGTWPGVMAGKRPPKGSPRVDVVAEAEPSHSGTAVGAEHAVDNRVANCNSERAIALH